MSINSCFRGFRAALPALILAAAAGLATAAGPTHFIVAPGQVQWSDPPAGMGRGKPSIDAGLPMTGPPGALPSNTGLPPPGVPYVVPLTPAQLDNVSVNLSSPRFGIRVGVRY